MYSDSEVRDMVEKAKSALGHISDLFVNASTLASKVQELEAKVEEMTRTVEHNVGQIQAYESSINSISAERGQARQAASDWQSRHDQLYNEHQSFRVEAVRTDEAYNRVRQELERVRKDKDDAYQLAEGLDKENQELKAKLREVETLVASIQERFMAKPHEGEQPRDPATGQYLEYPRTGTTW